MRTSRTLLYAITGVAAAAAIGLGALTLIGNEAEPAAPTALPIPAASPPLSPTSSPSPATSTPAPDTDSAQPVQRGPATGCAAQAAPHGTENVGTWRPAPLPYGAPCARPPGGPAWRPSASLAEASGRAIPPIRLAAFPEVLPDGHPADPAGDLPADILARVGALSEAWAHWVEADQAGERTASPTPIAEVAGYFGAEQYGSHYAQLALDRSASGAYAAAGRPCD